jgi:hypothetical protein
LLPEHAAAGGLAERRGDAPVVRELVDGVDCWRIEMPNERGTRSLWLSVAESLPVRLEVRESASGELRRVRTVVARFDAEARLSSEDFALTRPPPERPMAPAGVLRKWAGIAIPALLLLMAGCELASWCRRRPLVYFASWFRGAAWLPLLGIIGTDSDLWLSLSGWRQSHGRWILLAIFLGWLLLDLLIKQRFRARTTIEFGLFGVSDDAIARSIEATLAVDDHTLRRYRGPVLEVVEWRVALLLRRWMGLLYVQAPWSERARVERLLVDACAFARRNGLVTRRFADLRVPASTLGVALLVAWIWLPT